MARLQSKVSSGLAGEKGAAVQNPSMDDVGPKPPPVMPDNSQFNMNPAPPLSGHKPIDPGQVHGPNRPHARAERKN
jgi:hypothetical protein